MACLAPNKLADGTEVACRECKLCQLKAKNDWVGRNIAESKTSKFCYWITGTYGRGMVGESLHERAVILTYSDCQKLLKLLRRHGYECRFFITGEYGSDRGRAHWNIILYSSKPLPPFSGWDGGGRWVKAARMKQRFNWVRVNERGDPVYLQDGQPAYWWPHGTVYIEDLSVAGIQYVCKYVLKDFDANGKQGHKGQSKDPPLGTEWFRQIAERYVEQGLAPQSPAYRFPEARTREGVVIDFWLKGRPLEMYIKHYLAKWAERHGDKPHPPSQMLDLFQAYGRVVNDEAKMLVREQFGKKGEGIAPFMVPTREAMEPQREEREFRGAKREWSRTAYPERGWYEQWIGEAENEQERQERKREYDNYVWRCYSDFLAQWGRAWIYGRGIVKTGSPRPGEEPEQLQPDQQHPEPGASASGLGQPDYGLGPVGKYNRDYRTE